MLWKLNQSQSYCY